MRFIVVLILSLFSLVCDAQFMQFAPKKAESEFVLLDTFGTGNQYAFSMYKINSSYTGDCMLVRRSNDNATKRIPFNGNFLDTVDLKTFVGANSGFVARWYNQSPNNSDSAVQATAANQPRIVNAGVIERDRGIVSLFFDGSNDALVCNSTTVFQSVSSLLAYGVARGNTAAAGTRSIFNTSFVGTPAVFSFFALEHSANSGRAFSRRISSDAASIVNFTKNHNQVWQSYTLWCNFSSSFFLRNDNVSAGSAAFASTGNSQSNNIQPFVIGAANPTGLITFFSGYIAEIGAWTSTTLNQDRINTNINRRYKLY